MSGTRQTSAVLCDKQQRLTYWLDDRVPRIYRITSEDGGAYVFKPNRPGNDECEPYSAEAELKVYEQFSALQDAGCIPICYGTYTLEGQEGLLLQDCGPKTLEDPPEDENSKFILYMRAICTMGRCLAEGFIHEDMEFRNVVYDPDSLKVAFVDIEPCQSTYTPKKVWGYLDASFCHRFHYTPDTVTFLWGVSHVFNILKEHQFDSTLLLLVCRFSFYIMKKKLETNWQKYNYAVSASLAAAIVIFAIAMFFAVQVNSISTE